MAFGDIGGAVTELIITCRTPEDGEVAIHKGDAVKLTGAYTVDNAAAENDPVFGQALADCAQNGAAIPVKVRGICLFAYSGAAPAVNGTTGIVAAEEAGLVKAPATGAGQGINVKADTVNKLVHVLL